jgi:hypothetical protein|tara:strand:- start:12658 stop:14493 length:1836 start_codon:yes stop_codon:yes gene_type:complete
MKKKTLIDCIITTYRDHNKLLRTLKSLDNQINLRFNKIYIINDNGYKKIEQKKIVKSLNTIIDDISIKNIKKNIKIHHNKNNIGLGMSRNVGIKLTSSKYFTFLDCGDELTNDFLEIFNLHTKLNYDIIHGRLLKRDIKRNISQFQGDLYRYNINIPSSAYKYFFDNILLFKLPNQATARLYRTLFMKRKKIFFINQKLLHEDLAFTYKAIHQAKKQYFLNNPFVYVWNFFDGSISSQLTLKHLTDFLFIIKDTRNYFKKNTNINYKFFYINSRLYNFINSKISVTDKKQLSQFKDVIDHNMVQQVGRKLTIYDVHKSLRNKINKKIVDYYLVSKLKKFLSKNLSEKMKTILRYILINRKPQIKPKFLPVSISPSKNEDILILKKLKNKYKNKRCFIVGNGPSLNKTDLKKLKHEFTFGFNSIFLHKNFFPNFYIVEDKWVIKDNLEKIKKIKTKYKFIPAHYEKNFDKRDNCIHYPMDLTFYRTGNCNFSNDITDRVFSGQSVTYHAIQFAYYMGFNPIYLVGVDFSYIKPKTIIQSGVTWLSTGDDPNHFDKNYFGKGKTFHDPQLDKVKKNYELAHNFLKDKNKKIYNATIGSKLKVFPKVDYKKLFK